MRSFSSYPQFLKTLNEALDHFEYERATTLCDEFVAMLRESRSLPSDKVSADIVKTLRRKRAFREMCRVADALIESGLNAPNVQRQYIQALIEEGAIAASLAMARALEPELQKGGPDNAFDLGEVQGLIGRAYKQWYIQSGNVDFLRSSLKAYEAVYLRSPEENLWHGINSVALCARAKRDTVKVSTKINVQKVAGEIRDRVKKMEAAGKAEYWDLATATEACVALELPDEAISWAEKYVSSADADAFELASTLRQLKEVWQLDTTSSPGSLLLPLLEARLLKRNGSQLSVPANLMSAKPGSTPSGLEKVFGTDSYNTIQWYKRGLERCAGVARIENLNGQGIGTGFLIRGGDLKSDWGDEYLLLTNYHVLNVAGMSGALSPDRAIVKFHAMDQASKDGYQIAAILDSSDANTFDFTLARLSPPISLPKPLPISTNIPDPTGNRRLYAIGHPLGGELSFSLQDNLLLDFLEPRLHYRTPTDRGSSGSPIFDDTWNLVALHHAGDKQLQRLHGQGYYEANEGIWVTSIKRYLNRSGSASADFFAPASSQPLSFQSQPPPTSIAAARQEVPNAQRQQTNATITDLHLADASTEIDSTTFSVPLQISVRIGKIQ
ncbi:MAG: trypsin-like peptidase domain-containing protein [Planctomycetes bacterium]|nr:trypsin-like peptidase domain-containing protein [Planctomycetota bacterium]